MEFLEESRLVPCSEKCDQKPCQEECSVLWGGMTGTFLLLNIELLSRAEFELLNMEFLSQANFEERLDHLIASMVARICKLRVELSADD